MRRGLLAVAVVVAIAVVGLAIAIGEPVSWSRVLDPSSIDHAIVLRARVPRVLLGLVAGSGLAVTGAAYQGLLRNPLAEPYVLGVSGGAALGATIAIALVSALAPIMVASIATVAAALGGGLATLLVWVLATRTRSSHATSILLAGVVVNAIASGAITFVKTIVRASTAQQLLFWLAGFLDVPSTGSLVIVAVLVVVFGLALVVESPRLNLLAMGDEHAEHLGLDVRALERRIFIASSVVVGAVIATCGMIGFIGLLVPHIVRRMCGHDHRVVLPVSFALGGATLVACDLLARVTFRVLGTEPPVGAITALIGGPLFLFLLARRPVV